MTVLSSKIHVRIMDKKAGDRCVLVTPEVVEREIRPLMQRGYVLTAKLRATEPSQEQVALRHPEEINPIEHAELALRPAITAG
jgi:hypothetical protein